MGNNATQQTPNDKSATQRQFLSKIQKVSSSYSQSFGNYSIYQLQQKPYDYYMEYIQTSIPQSDMLQQKLRFYKNMPKNKNLVPVQFAQIIKKKQLCAEFDGLRVFCQYYNFTLEDAIRLKIKQRTNFTEGQIMYILRSLLSIGKFYQSQLKASYYSGIYHSKKIFLSPQGHVKIYPFNENTFSAYADLQLRQESNEESEIKVQSKKVSLQLNHNSLSRPTNDLAFSKNTNSNRSAYGIKRSKLTTTLSNNYYLSSTSSQQSFHNNHLDPQKLKSSQNINGFFPHQESSQSLGYLYGTENKVHEQASFNNRRDLFELGLLMMQLILLNESHEYFSTKNDSTIKTNYTIGGRSRIHFSNNYEQESRFTTFDNPNAIGSNLRKLIEEFENDSGKVPNIDLITFSLNKLLPKKNISRPLVSIIERMILNEDNPKPSIEELSSTIERMQELSTEPKYCIKFDIIPKDQESEKGSSDLHVSKYLAKNQSIDPFIKTTDLSYAYGGLDSANQSKIMHKKLLEQTFSKESFFTTTGKLDDLLNDGNMTNSIIAEAQCSGNASQVLNSLKKSRKLIPTKLRSISTKLPQKPRQTQEVDVKRYKLNFV